MNKIFFTSIFWLVLLNININASQVINEETKCKMIILQEIPFNKDKDYDKACMASYIAKIINNSDIKAHMGNKLMKLDNINSNKNFVIYNFKLLTDISIPKKSEVKNDLVKLFCSNITLKKTLFDNGIFIKSRYKQNGKLVLEFNLTENDCK